MTIYLAGPITGNPDYMADFARWEGSRGAQLEVDLARRLELRRLTVKDGKLVKLP